MEPSLSPVIGSPFQVSSSIVENNGLTGTTDPATSTPDVFWRLNAQKTAPPDTVANTSVRHVATGDGEWEFQAVSDFLYRWADIFNLEFFGRLLPAPVISFEPCRIEVLGYFFPGRNDQGLKFNINVNQQWLRLPEAELLEILLHEQIHLEQQVTGTAGKGNYHNKKFVQKAADVGLKVELGRGCHLGSPTEPFISLLKAHGVSFTPRESVVELPKPEKDKRRLRRWSCHCKSVWCGGDLAAMCLKCKEQFRPNPKRGG